MKRQSVHQLWKLKRQHPNLIEKLNSVLLHEGGAGAVLYPYNSQDETIVALAGEGMSDEMIAAKTGTSVEEVRNAIEAPGNYMSEAEFLARFCLEAK